MGGSRARVSRGVQLALPHRVGRPLAAPPREEAQGEAKKGRPLRGQGGGGGGQGSRAAGLHLVGQIVPLFVPGREAEAAGLVPEGKPQSGGAQRPKVGDSAAAAPRAEVARAGGAGREGAARAGGRVHGGARAGGYGETRANRPSPRRPRRQVGSVRPERAVLHEESLDRQAVGQEPRPGDQNVSGHREGPRVRWAGQRGVHALGRPKVHGKPPHRREAEVRHPAVGSGDGLEPADHLLLRRVLRPVQRCRVQRRRQGPRERVRAPSQQLHRKKSRNFPRQGVCGERRGDRGLHVVHGADRELHEAHGGSARNTQRPRRAGRAQDRARRDGGRGRVRHALPGADARDCQVRAAHRAGRRGAAQELVGDVRVRLHVRRRLLPLVDRDQLVARVRLLDRDHGGLRPARAHRRRQGCCGSSGVGGGRQKRAQARDRTVGPHLPRRRGRRHPEIERTRARLGLPGFESEPESAALRPQGQRGRVRPARADAVGGGTRGAAPS
mmetsp:Transcript_29070/g.65036  ORF Transcript_29070/g.65036 Transcript_29070/m.65036 type:complete len:498 (+) Transcript_29070:256-1749(+)